MRHEAVDLGLPGRVSLRFAGHDLSESLSLSLSLSRRFNESSFMDAPIPVPVQLAVKTQATRTLWGNPGIGLRTDFWGVRLDQLESRRFPVHLTPRCRSGL